VGESVGVTAVVSVAATAGVPVVRSAGAAGGAPQAARLKATERRSARGILGLFMFNSSGIPRVLNATDDRELETQGFTLEGMSQEDRCSIVEGVPGEDGFVTAGGGSPRTPTSPLKR